jgi:hypothetical protein
VYRWFIVFRFYAVLVTGLLQLVHPRPTVSRRFGQEAANGVDATRRTPPPANADQGAEQRTGECLPELVSAIPPCGKSGLTPDLVLHSPESSRCIENLPHLGDKACGGEGLRDQGNPRFQYAVLAERTVGVTGYVKHLEFRA